jgi:hypothetical protein
MTSWWRGTFGVAVMRSSDPEADGVSLASGRHDQFMAEGTALFEWERRIIGEPERAEADETAETLVAAGGEENSKHPEMDSPPARAFFWPRGKSPTS